MNFQLNFIISQQKERELFAFLTDACGCNILKGYSADGNFSVDTTETPALLLYLVVPKQYSDNIRMERCNSNEFDAKFTILPFDKNGDAFPLIRYERFDGSLYRIYAGTTTMTKSDRSHIKKVLANIKKWIKTNAKSCRREGSLLCGITVYDVS